jgi:alpha-L-fucosidase
LLLLLLPVLDHRKVHASSNIVKGVFLLLLLAADHAAAHSRKTTASNEENKFQTVNNIIPSWEELDARPLPTWYDDAKFGIFVHWGIFSVPSFNGEWMWHNWKSNNDTETMEYIQRTERYNSHFTYQEYAARFHAELYQPKEWAQVLAQSGAQYVVLTSKHHDGYCTYSPVRILQCAVILCYGSTTYIINIPHFFY